MSPSVRWKVFENVALIEMDRPPVNAIDVGLLREMDRVLDEIEKSAATEVAILTGTGSCFSAGLDLKQMADADSDARRALVLQLNRTLRRLFAFPKPLVAAVNGHAIAGGLILALCCDYRVAVEKDAQFGLTEVRVGIPFPVAAAAVAQSELEPIAVRKFALIGHTLPGEHALALGAFDELREADDLLPFCVQVAQDLAEIPAHAFASVKRQLRRTALTAMDAAIAADHDPMLDEWDTDESRAAVARVLSGDA